MTNSINQSVQLKDGERIDDLQCNGFSIIQNPNYFCFGMDAVLLANFATSRKNAKVIDLGTGTGIVPILMAAKGKGTHFTALEIQEDVAEMAGRSVMLNNISDRMDVICGDIKDVRKLFKPETYNVVTSNPPYIANDTGLENPNSPVNIARHEVLVSLEEVISAAAFLLKQQGTFAMVHKPFRIPEIITLMKKYKLEPKRMQLVQPRYDKEANMVLIEAMKGGKPMLKLLPTLNVYGDEGDFTRYTKEVIDIYNGTGY